MTACRSLSDCNCVECNNENKCRYSSEYTRANFAKRITSTEDAPAIIPISPPRMQAWCLFRSRTTIYRVHVRMFSQMHGIARWEFDRRPSHADKIIRRNGITVKHTGYNYNVCIQQLATWRVKLSIHRPIHYRSTVVLVLGCTLIIVMIIPFILEAHRCCCTMIWTNNWTLKSSMGTLSRAAMLGIIQFQQCIRLWWHAMHLFNSHDKKFQRQQTIIIETVFCIAFDLERVRR